MFCENCMTHYSMTGHTVRTIYIIRSAVGKCIYGRIDGIVLGIRTLRRKTAVEREKERERDEKC